MRCVNNKTNYTTTSGKYVQPDDYAVKITVVPDNARAITNSVSTNTAVKVESVTFNHGTDYNLVTNEVTFSEEVYATVKLLSTNGVTGVVTEVPIPVSFSFTNGVSNVVYTASHQDGGTWLGKRDNTAALHWSAHTKSASTSADNYKKVAQSTTVTNGADKGRAYINFLPSAVGGDTFTLKASTPRKSDTNDLATTNSGTMTIWRKVSFDRMKMVGEGHIDVNASEAAIRPYYETTAQAYVQYNVSPTVTELRPEQCVKYIGLWTNNTATGNQRANWAIKINDTNNLARNETPTEQQWTNAVHGAGTTQTVARAEIKTMAQRWKTRITNEFEQIVEPQWVTDNAPAYTIIAIRYYHPKYSPDTEPEGVTSEWPRYDWLKVDMGGYDDFPDERWGGSFLGTHYASNGIGQITIAKGLSTKTQCVTAHEVGHGTRDFFKRVSFGLGDHFPTRPALMYWAMDIPGTTLQFNPEEQRILKGEKVP